MLFYSSLFSEKNRNQILMYWGFGTMHILCKDQFHYLLTKIMKIPSFENLWIEVKLKLQSFTSIETQSPCSYHIFCLVSIRVSPINVYGLDHLKKSTSSLICWWLLSCRSLKQYTQTSKKVQFMEVFWTTTQGQLWGWNVYIFGHFVKNWWPLILHWNKFLYFSIFR